MKKQFELDEGVFYTQTNHYIDKADKPLYDTLRGCEHVEQTLLHAFPFVEESNSLRHTVDKLYVPFTYNGASFLNTNIPNIQLNHPYPPIGVLYFVLREYPKQFREQVDGLYVDRDDFYEYRNMLNEVVHRVEDGKGRGAKYGMASKDEMIRIAVLYYIVQKTSNVGITEPLEWSGENNAFLNPWCGQKERIYFDSDKFEQYVAKIQDRVYTSAVNWQQFFFSFADESDQDSLWFWNLPNFYHEEWFDLNDFVDLFNELTVLDNRDSYLLITCPKTDEIENTFKRVLGFEHITGEVWGNDQFAMFGDMMSGMDDYVTICNYYPSSEKNFKRFSEMDTAKLAGGYV